jgi:TnpA family transposase
MPRRELLTLDEREKLLAIPQEESERIRHYTLSRADLGFIHQHRWVRNRLGVAVQLCVLRYPVECSTAASSRRRRSWG